MQKREKGEDTALVEKKILTIRDNMQKLEKQKEMEAYMKQHSTTQVYDVNDPNHTKVQKAGHKDYGLDQFMHAMKNVKQEDLLKQTDKKGCRITFKDSGKPLLQNKVAVTKDKMIR